MERQFLNINMKYIHVVPVDNGITWTVERMCQQICTAYEALDIPGTVLVWIDREGRTETAEDIHHDVLTALISSGAPPDDTHVMINDKMAENVILADEHVIQTEFNLPAYIYQAEGYSGKAILKQMYKMIGEHYKETKHGIELLKKIRLSRSAAKSPSVQRFLVNFNHLCWWVSTPPLIPAPPTAAPDTAP